MEIRKSTAQDLEQIMALYEQARDFMRQSGNPNQWGNAYPSREMISADIAAGKSYQMCIRDRGIIHKPLMPAHCPAIERAHLAWLSGEVFF